jgi:hypothetical protein
MNIDIEKSFYAKLKKNVIKYPVSLSKGNSQKRQ